MVPSRISFLLFSLALRLTTSSSPWSPIFSIAARALLSNLSFSQKLSLVHGSPGAYAGNTPDILLPDGIFLPGIRAHDGPQGVGNGAVDVTAWPAALTVSQAWDPALSFTWGAAMGREQFLKGVNTMLGPGVNLARVPWNGRNFVSIQAAAHASKNRPLHPAPTQIYHTKQEYLGEDPWLASALVAAEVRGIQSQKVSACVKHGFFNNFETDRGEVSANVPDRAARELYYKPFAAAVDAGVVSFFYVTCRPHIIHTP